MYALYTEQRSLNGKDTLSWDLAQHMYLRSAQGKVIVVTDKPRELCSATSKQWMKLMRKVMRQRASTLNATRVVELTYQICYMQNLRLSARQPNDYLEAGVTFATADDLIRVAPICHSAYITSEIEDEKLHMLTSWMPEGGVVVVYKHPLQTLIKKYPKELRHGANARTANQKSYQATLR